MFNDHLVHFLFFLLCTKKTTEKQKIYEKYGTKIIYMYIYITDIVSFYATVIGVSFLSFALPNFCHN